jgi:SAM-dependent methyltransferase
MSLKFDEHRQYLEDTHRLDAFRRAIDATVRPGDVVIDLGCGTGILGLMACRAGASRVYAIDDGGMIDIARHVAVANGYGDRVVHIQGNSMRVTLPEQAHVIVSDQIGRLGFEAGVVEYFGDAARRFLRPGGRLIPAGVTTWLAPIEAPALTAVVDFWRSAPGDFDFSPVSDGAANTGYPATLAVDQNLAAAAPVLQFECGKDASAAKGAASFAVTRPGVLSGLGGWFVADLAPGITMTNGPGARDQIGRRQAFLPIANPVRVDVGDQIDVVLRARPVEVVLAWDVRVTRAGAEVAHARHSTLAGMLVPRETLARTNPSKRPQLTPWADARATVLSLCDGTHTLADIELATATRHAELFANAGEAQEFVAEVVTRYGRDDGE